MDFSALKNIIISALAALFAAFSVSFGIASIYIAKPAKSQSGKYLFCYFVGNDPTEERIHFAVSEDGYNFEPINSGEPVITSNSGTGCVRDPYILEGKDGYFYIIATDMKSEDGWVSNHALITWRSKDLITWEDETVIDIRDFGGEFANTNRAWAPQAIWDEEKGRYMVYWANSTEENDVAAMYYAYTSDFKTITEPQLLYAREGMQTIDGDIVYNEKSGKYYLYFKFEETQKIAYVTSESLNGPYEDSPVVVSLAKTGVEGSEMYRINGTDTWVMIMDEYHKGRFFAQQTTDMENFKKLPSSSYSYAVNPRHGSVVSITDEQYEALISHYGK